MILARPELCVPRHQNGWARPITMAAQYDPYVVNHPSYNFGYKFRADRNFSTADGLPGFFKGFGDILPAGTLIEPYRNYQNQGIGFDYNSQTASNLFLPTYCKYKYNYKSPNVVGEVATVSTDFKALDFRGNAINYWNDTVKWHQYAFAFGTEIFLRKNGNNLFFGDDFPDVIPGMTSGIAWIVKTFRPFRVSIIGYEDGVDGVVSAAVLHKNAQACYSTRLWDNSQQVIINGTCLFEPGNHQVIVSIVSAAGTFNGLQAVIEFDFELPF